MESFGNNWNWTETVEDLVQEGDIEKAITLLESLISKLEKEARNGSSSSELVTALLDLSKQYATQGFSFKADEARIRAFQIKREFEEQGVRSKGELNVVKNSSLDGLSRDWDSNNMVSSSDQDGFHKDSLDLENDSMSKEDCSDDWETVADCASDELLSPTKLPEISKLTLEDIQVKGPKRRGRGTFSYGKHGLYSDEKSDKLVIDDEEHNADSPSIAGDTKITDLMYGTHHVLVLADFPPSTKTTDLEKVLERFKDSGVAIRWVNDTVALAVFRSPSMALEASTKISFPFTVRILEENDELLASIPQRDLEPPRLRPKTSARTAQRLIAQSMGIRLASPGFGSRELRQQEEARKSRIVSRQNMIDEAWGDDTN